MPNDTHRDVSIRPLESDETLSLISSEKVDGTDIYNRNGDNLGTVHHLMIDKFSGNVEYAVISFGGFLGMGESYHPLPWKVLDYDTDKHGYVVDLDEEMLKKAPSYRAGKEPRYDRAYDEQVFAYYGLPFFGV